MKRTCKQFLQRFEFGLTAVSLFAIIFAGIGGTRLYGQNQAQSQASAQVRSRAEETLEWWNQIGKKLIAMAKDFPEDKYDFKVQKDERTFGGKSCARCRGGLRHRQQGCRVTRRAGLWQGQAQPAVGYVQDEGGRGETARGGGGGGGEGDLRTRRRGAEQYPALWLGNRQARRSQFLHLAERHRAQHGAFRPTGGVLPRK